MKHHPHFRSRKAKEKREKAKAALLFPEDEFNEYWNKHHRDVERAVYDAFLDVLAQERIFITTRNAFGVVHKQELNGSNIEKFCDTLPKKMNNTMMKEMMPSYGHVIYSVILNCDNMPLVSFTVACSERVASRLILDYLRDSKKNRQIIDYARDRLSELIVYEQIEQNPHYPRIAYRLKKTMAAKKLLYESIQTSTPDDYTELFPLTRKMERHFILHIGPTNSGKTYQAIEDLKAAESGIYLAPLRLLAYEQYERMNKEGCPCSMITGEERILMPGSFHQASTIEMMDLREEWDVAVIDEAQMVADRQRGGSWTNAILGLRAKRIHICASPDAEKILVRMITSCKDTMEVMYHERKTPLEMDAEATDFRFPEDVKKGDALIVFSRKDVHGVAAELQNIGVKCSIIYGSLPYDVRHREAGKFAESTTDVVVATDAIGMGMNLPINRIVFLQTTKFDGVKERMLTSSEVKQIAGRAGRYGLYDVGYVTSYYDYDQIATLLTHRSIPVNKAMINIPEEFLEKDGKVSTILEMWNRIPAADYYDKGDIDEKIKIAQALEQIEDNRELIRTFIKMPMNIDNKELFQIYTGYYKDLVKDRPVMLNETMAQYNPLDIDMTSKQALQLLETASTVYDFLYNFVRVFGEEGDLEPILEVKRQISEKIFEILDMQKLSMKTCVCCGKRLKWSYRFTMCQECFRKRR